MTAYIGVDPGLVSTGVARLCQDADGAWSVKTGAIGSRPVGKAADMHIVARHIRIQTITGELRSWLTGGDLVVIERMFNSRGAGTVERAWLWGAIASRAIAAQTRVLELTPQYRAMFACGKGNADKAAVALGVQRMWPQWTPSVAASANDEADALVLASIAAALDGAPVPFEVNNYRQRVLDKIREKAG